ncbi:MAG: excinuclease ABC subunit A [Rhodospirillales bacterium]|nr:MAG: excinuclease ABC subunit A [Rhodospirillales bacterium]
MIASFRCKDSRTLWQGETVRRFQAIHRQALRRLDILNAATSLEDLMRNPGNHFEALKGNRKGQFSIRVNLQWRICFIWNGHEAHDVEIVDYH